VLIERTAAPFVEKTLRVDIQREGRFEVVLFPKQVLSDFFTADDKVRSEPSLTN
jgi:hypothetical protein